MMVEKQQILPDFRTRYEAAQLALSELHPRFASSQLDCKRLTNEVIALEEEKSLLLEKLEQLKSEHDKIKAIELYEQEIEHLRQKIREMDALVRDKDAALEQVFGSVSFKLGHRITRLLKVLTRKNS